MYYSANYDAPLGVIEIICTDKALVGLRLPGQPGFAWESSPAPEEHPVILQTRAWLDRYFAGEQMDPKALPLAPEGSPFRRVIWDLLLEIPYGEARTYGELARAAAAILGKEKMSAQAVGGAVGANPISIVIPCHRCLGTGGRLTGYAGGVELKRALLDLERIPYKDG